MDIVIIGCGVVGAAIAYQLSQVKGLNITVFDKNQPAQGSTAAALGVLMGVISHKIKGKAWKIREDSIKRYETLIPELEGITGRKIPCNRQGIVMLLSEDPEHPLESGVEVIAEWEQLREVRKTQGWQLAVWDREKLQKFCPQINHPQIIGAAYSPQDLQLNPTALTLALVDAAQRNGVKFKFGVNVRNNQSISSQLVQTSPVVTAQLKSIDTTEGTVNGDWFIVSAGLGSTLLTTQLHQKINVRPVLGQALYLSLGRILGNPDFQPVITGNDINLVPMGGGDYWVGATVEFPQDNDEVYAKKELLESLRQQVIGFCPDLSEAKILRTWSGLRPRPEGRPAPVIEKLPAYSNVIVATGHYRNGVLLAPSTALAVQNMIFPSGS